MKQPVFAGKRQPVKACIVSSVQAKKRTMLAAWSGVGRTAAMESGRSHQLKSG